MKTLRKALDIAPAILLGAFCLTREEAEYIVYIIESGLISLGIKI